MNLTHHAAHWSASNRTPAAAPRMDGYVLILQDERGLVLIEHTENPALLISRMQAEGLQVQDRRQVFVHSHHAREIALSLRQQFREFRKQDLPMAWFSVDWQPVMIALEDWDTAEGRILRTGELLIGTQVTFRWLDKAYLGQIHGFKQEGGRRMAHVRVAKRSSMGDGVALLSAWCDVNELQPVVTSTEKVPA